MAEAAKKARAERKRLLDAGFKMGRKGWVLPPNYNGEHKEAKKDFPFTLSRKAAISVLSAME